MAKSTKVVAPTQSKAQIIRDIIIANPEITIVEVIAQLAEKNISCRRSEVTSAVNKLSAE